jgi:hypothetical protein
MSDYSTAVHEASHAVVGYALGMKFCKRAITIIPSNGLIGQVRFRQPWASPKAIRTAVDIAGAMADCRVKNCTLSDATTWGSDINHILLNHGDCDPDGKAVLYAARELWTKEVVPWAENAFVCEIVSIVIALCKTSSTSEATEMFAPECKERISRSYHFQQMAESADMARSILDTHWSVVLDLAQHLLVVKKMSGAELTAYLNTRMHLDAGKEIESQEMMRAEATV